MAQHARIEELSDSDSASASDSDPPEDDLSSFTSPLITPSDIPPPAGVSPSQFSERQISSQSQSQSQPNKPFQQTPPPDYKRYQTIYPLYFDARRTRSEGRRVGKEQAVENPLAREIVDAVQALGLKVVFEPGKTHPRDWANPGRVRACLKEGGRPVAAPRVKNKQHLYTLISSHLRSYPATPSTPLRLRIQGMPPPTGPAPPPAVPKGWKMNAILPLHSPALSGGGVSENILKDVMAEMQGAGGMPGGIPGLGGGAGQGGLEGPGAGEKRKKDKEGKKKK